jgi:hypothetical protein
VLPIGACESCRKLNSRDPGERLASSVAVYPPRPRSLIMASMRLASITRATFVFALSCWMAAVACVIGCMQPVIARSEPSISNVHSRNGTQSGLMADMDCCNHESSSAPTNDKRPSPHDSVSCCPLDASVTPTQKLNPPILGIAFKADTVSSREFHFAFALFCDPLVFAHAFWHSGRDTLLKVHVLRI